MVLRPKKYRAVFRSWRSPSALAIIMLTAHSGWGGEVPFLTTYTHQMEEPGNLEIGIKSVTGKPDRGNRFLGAATEFEYSLSDWWMTEVYLDGQATSSESTLFTGYRWENRFRLLPHEHWINPVLYFEFENITSADKTLLEVVGRDGIEDLSVPNRNARLEKNRELEAKLILGSSVKGWTIAENFIAEKNVRHAPFEFGYSAGVSRALASDSKPGCRNVCAKNIQLGVEMYGGLGTHDKFGIGGTSHYVAPVVAWTLANGTTFYMSPGFGITDASVPFLLRVGLSYGIDGFGRMVRNFFHSQASLGPSATDGVPGPAPIRAKL